MQLDAAEIHDPGESGRVVDDDLLRGAAGGKGERDRLEPRGPLVGRALLIERLGFGAVDEALEHEWAVADARNGAVGDGQVVPNEGQLRELYVAREVRLAGIGDADLASLDGEQRRGVFLGHLVMLVLHRLLRHPPSARRVGRHRMDFYLSRPVSISVPDGLCIYME